MATITRQFEDTDSPSRTLHLAKEYLQKRNYREARKEFDSIIHNFPDKTEAREAKFYCLLLDFIHEKESLSDAKKYFSGENDEQTVHPFYSDIEDFIFEFVSLKREIKNLNESISKLKKRKLDADNELIKVHNELEKVMGDYRRMEIELKTQKDNYRRIQEIEMKRERREKELRELAQ
jgi:hypoxanthine phosphoribosyltransferase